MLEPTFSEFSYGSRKGRSSKDLVKQFRKNVDDGYQWIAYIDIENCFENIDPSTALGLIDSRIDGYFPERFSGLPQGHPLSPLLCNLYLSQFDKAMESYVKPSKIRDLDFRFLRYVDDIWLMARNKKAIELYTSRAVSVLEELGFKSRDPIIRHVNQGIDVLGFTVKRWSIRPSTKSLKKLRDRLIRLVCRYLEMNNDEREDQCTKEHADNTDPIQDTIDNYHKLNIGWTNYYGQDTYTQTRKQWQTLDYWIAMMEDSGAIPSSDRISDSEEVPCN